MYLRRMNYTFVQEKSCPALKNMKILHRSKTAWGWLQNSLDEIDQGIADFDALRYRAVSVATGEDFAPFMKKIAKRLHRIYNININVYPIKNDFFGREVTVTGLLTGTDIISQLKGRNLGEKVFLSGSVFREFTDVTLDDMPIGEMAKNKLGRHARQPRPTDMNGFRCLQRRKDDKTAGRDRRQAECRQIYVF